MSPLTKRGTVNFQPNHVLIGSDLVHDGFMQRATGVNYYALVVDDDLTDKPIAKRVVSTDLRTYLDRYFAGWRLLRRVNEVRNNPAAPPFKHVHFLLGLETDADADTVKSRLRKIDYEMPWQKP